MNEVGANFKVGQDRLRAWGNGPWFDEVDLLGFSSEGFNCRIIRSIRGNLCGQIFVDKVHPWFGKSFLDITADVYGGLTYCEQEKDKWAVGFDCAHEDDIIPVALKTENLLSVFKKMHRLNGDPVEILHGNEGQYAQTSKTYKDIKFVRNELNKLAIQASILRPAASN